MMEKAALKQTEKGSVRTRLKKRAMRLLKHLFANRSIRFKLLFTFVSIIILSIVTLGLLGSYMYKKSIEEETTSYTIQMMNQVKNHIEVYIQEMDNIAHYLAEEEAIISFMEAGEDAEGFGLLQETAQREMGKFERQRFEIAGMLLVNEKNAFASNTIDRITRDPLTEEGWYQTARLHPEAYHLISHPIGRNIKAKENFSVNQVLSFVKAVRHPATNAVIGVILIDLKLDFIQSIVESVSLGKSGFVFIMDETDGVVYSPANPIVYRIMGRWLDGYSGSLVKSIFGLNYRMFYNTFPDNGWRIVGVLPLSESLKVVSDLHLYTVIVAVITLCFAFFVTWFFTNSIVRPVGNLRSLMRKVEEGQLHLRFRSQTNDEIGQLGNSFNKMVEEIENLIDLVYIEQKEKREAELKALQAQIKPHFLYNTLDTIHWMAEERGAHDIVEIIVALTHLFRISLSKGIESIPLEEELQHVDSYLVIQLARYESKLSYEMIVPDELKKYKVLKIVLQPLVENAIYHGIKTKRGNGKIIIMAYQEANSLILTVEDDGAGIAPEQLLQLQEDMQRPRDGNPKRGYGLYNVNERIKLTHGMEYGLLVDSAVGSGTVITVRLPLIHK